MNTCDAKEKRFLHKLPAGMTDYGGLCARQTKYTVNRAAADFVWETGRLKVVDPNTGRILGANKTEEIWAKSSYMMNGYYNNPESTKNVIDSDGKHEIVRYVIV